MQFDTAVNSVDCIKICNKFLGKLRMPADEKKQLRLLIIWQACSNFDVTKSKFTTHLYNTARFQYLKYINKSVRNKFNKNKSMNRFESQNYNPIELIDLFDSLNEDEQDLINDRFIYKFSLLEISKKRKIKILDVQEKLKSVLIKIKNSQ